MHRSGTSALAKCIIDLGFDAGANLIQPGSDNPNGFWEDNDVYNLNNEILEFLFLSWDQVEDFEKRKLKVYEKSIPDSFSQRAISLIQSKFTSASKVIIKDPRFCILLPFWNKILEQIKAEKFFIHIIRNPLSVAGSLKQRNGISVPDALILWYYNNVTALKEVAHQPLLISYHELLNDPRTEISRIAKFIAISPSEIPNTYFHPDKFSVHKEFDHHSPSNMEFDGSSESFPKSFQLWEFLNQFTGNNYESFSLQAMAQFIEPGFSRYLKKVTATKFIATLSFKEKNKPEIEKIINETHGTGKVKITFPIGPPGSLMDSFEIFLCDKPCQVSEMKINWRTAEEIKEIKPSGGSFLFSDNNSFYFDTNSPCFKFSLPELKTVTSIEFQSEIVILQNENPEMLIPALHAGLNKMNRIILEKQSRISRMEKHLVENISEYGQLLQQIQTEKSNFTDQLTTIKNQTENLKDETEKQKLLIEHQNTELEQYKSDVAQLEKKSLWLYTEYNNMIDSVSWKITYPLRIIQKIIHRAGYLGYVLLNDIHVGFLIFKKAGFSGFFFRLTWYLRGKRLKEDIEMAKTKKKHEVLKNEVFYSTSIIEFPEHENPLVSIVIPAFNSFSYTCKCLESVKKNAGDVSYEIIVADDHSNDQTRLIQNYFKGIRVVRNEKNMGFVLTCNSAARQAKGEFIYFLNNDTITHPDWLKPLVKLFFDSEKTGIAGSRLIYPDGKLQEAGGIIWNDATGWNYGKFDNPEKSEYNYEKEVDYVSGASLMIRKTLWENLGGFDQLFSPAYYEDTDLAFRARQSGYKVIYQPQSVVTHYEGQSNGGDQSAGIKRNQEINRKKFLLKWRKVLQAECSPNGKNLFLHRDRSVYKRQLLVIDHYVPHFDQDAGSRSTFNFLKLFVEMGFNVKFIGDNFYRHQPYTSILQQLGIEVLYGDYYQKNIREWIRENGRFFDVIIAHRMHIAPKYLTYLKKFSSATIAYVGHDLQFKSSLRKFGFTGDGNHLKDSEKFKEIETRIFNTVDIIFPFSTYEAPFIREIVPHKIVQTIPVFFYDKIPGPVPNFASRTDILFVGFFGHPPNIDAALWFSAEVFPIVQRLIPEVKLLIVGSKPTDEIKQLEGPFINVTGHVSDDKLIEYYRKCKVAVLPLRYGAGVKGKLLESLCHQIPTVITSVAAEGVDEIEKSCLISDNADDFAEQIHKVYTDENVWNNCASEGKELIKKYFTKEAARKIMEDVFEKKPHC